MEHLVSRFKPENCFMIVVIVVVVLKKTITQTTKTDYS
jgi:hypothetical protein